MSDCIPGVTQQDDVGVIQQAAFDAKAIVTEQSVQTGAVEAAEQQAVGQEVLEKQAGNADECLAPEAKGSTEGNLAVSLGEEAVLPAAVQVASSLTREVSNPDPAKMDAGKLAKQTNGMARNAQTIEGAIKTMKSGGKLGSFTAAFNKKETLLGDIGLTGDFLSKKGEGVNSGSKAASGELASLRQVKQVVYGQRLASEQKLTQAQVALEQKGPQMAQAQQQYGMAGPSMGLGNGPKFKQPKEEVQQDDTSAWA